MYPESRATSLDSRTPADAIAGPPDSNAQVPFDDGGGDGDDNGGNADDPAEAANRDPLRRRRPRHRPEARVRRREASAAEKAAPSSGDRPGCRLIRGSFEACRPYLS